MTSKTEKRSVTWRESYNPFGEKRLDPAANADNTGFTGHLSDDATDLVYMQARYYDPVIGRFLSTDPIGYEDQLNLYAYVHNDPVNATDPTGEFANFLIGAALGAVADVAIQVFVEGKSLSEVDTGRVVASAAVGALTGGASSFARVAATGTTRAITTVAGKEVAKTVTLNAGERVAAGAIAAELGTGGAVLNEKVSADADGRDFSPARAATKAAVSPIPGGVPAAEAAFDKAAESQQQNVEVDQPCGDGTCE